MKKKRLLIILLLASGIILGSLVLIFEKHIFKNYGKATVMPDTLQIKPDPPLLMFGIPVDSYYTETGTVKKNQILTQIVSLYNLPDRSLGLLCTLPKEIFDMRKIKAGNNYMLFLSRDTLNMLKFFVYEHSPVDYTVFDFTDSLRIYSWKKDIKQIEKLVQGKIESSLWNTITQQNINPMLALELSDIYAWTIDFFGLQPGDSFSVVYDELYVDDDIVGLGHIHAAYFRHNGNEYFAIPFVQDSVESYYDFDGNSLRRAFLKAPLHFRRIASRYSHSRFHPILKIYRPHHGVDYSAPVGTPVYSIGDGKVIEMAYKGQAGRMVKIRHNSIYTSAYLHLSRYAGNIKPGAYVRQGDIIGYVGSSGLSTGPHLDFRVYKNGSPIDPLKIESPPVEPVRPENMQAFEMARERVLKKLMPEEENALLKIIKPLF